MLLQDRLLLLLLLILLSLLLLLLSLSLLLLLLLFLSLLHTDFRYCSLYISGLLFLSFGNNKFPQISSTCRRILADCSNTVFFNSTILVSIPISFSLFGNAFGVVPSAPIITGITLTFFFQSFSIPLLLALEYLFLFFFSNPGIEWDSEIYIIIIIVIIIIIIVIVIIIIIIISHLPQLLMLKLVM